MEVHMNQEVEPQEVKLQEIEAQEVEPLEVGARNFEPRIIAFCCQY